MNWKTAMQGLRGLLAGAGVVAGIAAVARSASLSRTLAGYLPQTQGLNGIRSQAAQAASDALEAGLVFYDSVRLLLLFLGVAMICAFGILLADSLRQLPVDVLVDSRGVDTLRRRLARLASRLARRLDPEEERRPQELPSEGRTIDLSAIEVSPAETVREDKSGGEG